MLEKFRQEWQRFKRRKPGQRFQERYREKQKLRRGVLRKVLVTASGALIFAIGVFLLAFPGPGTILIFIGASLIGEESLLGARGLDWLEIRLRSLYRRGMQLWNRTSLGVKVLLLICALVIAGSLAFGAYKIAFSA
jgi:hypothetical protein